MAEPSEKPSVRKVEPPLVDRILQTGKAAFDPSIPEGMRTIRQQDFLTLMNDTSTLSLMPVLNLLAQPDRVQPWLRGPVMSNLARLPLRPRGVQHTIEFVLSVHPTTSGARSEQRPGGGSAISHEALNAASKLLSSPPAGMNPQEWFSGIAPQLYSLLSGEGEPEMDKAAAYIIGFGILGRRQYGAPGMPGWKALVEPIFRHIDPDLVPALPSNIKSPDFIVNLSGVKPLTSAEDLATAVNRLSVLISSHPNPSLTKRLLKPILLPLWALSSWPVEDGSKGTTTVHEQSRSLVKALIQLTTNGSANKDLSLGLSPVVQDIFNNIQFKGRWVHTDIPWEYATNEKGEIQIQTRTKNVDDSIIEAFQRIDVVVSAFVGLLGSIPDTSPEISALFLQLFRKWSIASRKTKPQVILHLEPWEDTQDIHKKLIETKMLQHLIDTFPDNLVDDASQVLEITGEILSQADIETHQDMLAVALSLLNTVLMSPKFKTSIAIEDMLNGIQNSLAGISRSQADISTTAKNLQMLLKFRRAMEEPDQSPSPKLNPQIEDRKTYQLALSYLTALDSPPPVRVQGLDLFSGLIKTSSPVLDIPSLLILLSSLLQDSEEYLYLRTIRSFIELSERHPRTVLKDLVERYVDSQEESELDQRLRFGEAILQVIQNRPMALVHETSKIVCEGLLFIASRRGYRPKTEQTQQRREKLKKQKDEEADEAWDRDVPQLDEVLEIPTEEDKETMAQIVGGWESKRGSEDVRIRTSALAILAEAIEINIDGIIPQILSAAVDLCIYILTLEPEPEKGILRRSAILMILSFAKALDKARQEGKKLSFGFVGQSLEDVQRILAYVEGSDNDGLVRRHARDVIESLQAWQMSALAPSTRNQQSTGLQNLAGLSVNPMTERNLSGRSRPRIEEIE